LTVTVAGDCGFMLSQSREDPKKKQKGGENFKRDSGGKKEKLPVAKTERGKMENKAS